MQDVFTDVEKYEKMYGITPSSVPIAVCAPHPPIQERRSVAHTWKEQNPNGKQRMPIDMNDPSVIRAQDEFQHIVSRHTEAIKTWESAYPKAAERLRFIKQWSEWIQDNREDKELRNRIKHMCSFLEYGIHVEDRLKRAQVLGLTPEVSNRLADHYKHLFWELYDA